MLALYILWTIFEYAEYNAVLSSTIHAKTFCDFSVCLIENRSTTRGQQRVWDSIKFSICLFYMWPTLRSVPKNKFSMFLTIFKYAESNADRYQAQIFMQRLEFYDL